MPRVEPNARDIHTDPTHLDFRGQGKKDTIAANVLALSSQGDKLAIKSSLLAYFCCPLPT